MLFSKVNPHKQAWYHVRRELFGSVCEVTRNKPWGFKEDDDNIINYDVEEFLNCNDFHDTIILHILFGEGESSENVLGILNHAYESCVKLLVLEHGNPTFIEDWIRDKREKFVEISCGKNTLYALTTMSPLHLPQLTDDYLDRHLDYKYVSEVDYSRAIELGIAPDSINGLDKHYKIYTHTSESSINFKLPKGVVYWTIGGGLAYESMEQSNENILFDCTLLQVLYCAKIYGVPSLKLSKLFDEIDQVGAKLLPYESQNGSPRHWRRVVKNNVCPESIIHKNIEDLQVCGDTIYTSTITKDKWEHLLQNNNTISSMFPRNRPKLYQSG